MIDKSRLKYYLIPGGILFVIFITILLLPISKKNEQISTTATPIPTQPSRTSPTRIHTSITPTDYIQGNGPSPTLIPPHFTGADMSQDLPVEVQKLSEQKTALRKKTPLTLPFGVLTYDYEEGTFILTLNAPKDASKLEFETWLQQNYSSIPADRFAIQ